MGNRVKFAVAGVSFNKEIVDYLQQKLIEGFNFLVKLEIDEENQYDENAIKVLITDKKDNEWVRVGWVPKSINELVKMAINDNSVNDVRLDYVGNAGYVNNGVKVSFELT